MKRLKSIRRTLAVFIVALLAFQTVAFAETTGYVVKDSNGNFLQFDLQQLDDSYEAYRADNDSPDAEMYKRYMASSTYPGKVVAQIDDVGGYISQDELANVFDAIKAQNPDATDLEIKAMVIAYQETPEPTSMWGGETVTVVGADGEDTGEIIAVDEDGKETEPSEVDIAVNAAKTALNAISAFDMDEDIGENEELKTAVENAIADAGTALAGLVELDSDDAVVTALIANLEQAIADATAYLETYEKPVTEPVEIESIKVLTTTEIEVTLAGDTSGLQLASQYGPGNFNFAVAEHATSASTAQTEAKKAENAGKLVGTPSAILAITQKYGEENVYVIKLNSGAVTPAHNVAVAASGEVSGVASGKFTDSTKALLTDGSEGVAGANKVSDLDTALYYSVQVKSGADTGKYITANAGAAVTTLVDDVQYILPKQESSAGDIELVNGITYEIKKNTASAPIFSEDSLILDTLDNATNYNIWVVTGLGSDGNEMYLKADGKFALNPQNLKGSVIKALDLIPGVTYKITLPNDTTATLGFNKTAPSGALANLVGANNYALTLGGTTPEYLSAITDVVIKENPTGMGNAETVIPRENLVIDETGKKIYIPFSAIDGKVHGYNTYTGSSVEQTVTINAEGYAPVQTAAFDYGYIDTVKPALSSNSTTEVLRKSDVEVEIKIYPTEALAVNGRTGMGYFYAYGTAAKDPDTTIAGGNMAINGNTITISTLSAGTQVVSIVLIDARGNASDRIDITVDPYVKGLASSTPYTKAASLEKVGDIMVDGDSFKVKLPNLSDATYKAGSANFTAIKNLINDLNIGDAFEVTSDQDGSLISKIVKNSSGTVTVNLTSGVNSALTLIGNGTPLKLVGSIPQTAITIGGNISVDRGGVIDLSGLVGSFQGQPIAGHGAVQYNTAAAANITLNKYATDSYKLTINSAAANDPNTTVAVYAPDGATVNLHNSADNVTINDIAVIVGTQTDIKVTDKGLSAAGNAAAYTIDATDAERDVTFELTGDTSHAKSLSLKTSSAYTLKLLTSGANLIGSCTTTLKGGKFDFKDAKIATAATSSAGVVTLAIDGNATSTIVSGSAIKVANITVATNAKNILIIEDGATVIVGGATIEQDSGKIVIKEGSILKLFKSAKEIPYVTNESTAFYQLTKGEIWLTAVGANGAITIEIPDNSTVQLGTGPSIPTQFVLGDNSNVNDIIKINGVGAEFKIPTGKLLLMRGKTTKIEVLKGTLNVVGTIEFDHYVADNSFNAIDVSGGAKLIVAASGKIGFTSGMLEGAQDTPRGHCKINIQTGATVEMSGVLNKFYSSAGGTNVLENSSIPGKTFGFAKDLGAGNEQGWKAAT